MAKTRKTSTNDENIVRMTQEAYNELLAELENRKEVLRKEIADEIAQARDLGDLSENHAYTVAMEKKEMNENRIVELEGVIAIAQVAEEGSMSKTDFITVGDKIELQNVETKEKRVIILVGSEESKASNPLEGKISVESPIGKAVYNALVGDVVDVVLPTKTTQYKIVKKI